MTIAKRPGEQLVPEPPASTRDTLWHNPDFLKFWSGEGLSLFGTQVTNLAMPLTAVLVFNASSQEVGLLRFLQLVPYLFFGLLFGVWVDRNRRKPIMLMANAVRMVLIASVPLLSHYHHLSIAGLLLIAFVVGTFSVLFDVSWMAYIPALIKDAKHYVEANQKMGVTHSTTDVAGPGVAGLLVGWIGAVTALVIDAASYLVSLATLLWIRTPEPAPPRPTGKRRLRKELGEGVRWVFGDPILRPLAMLAPFTNASMNCVWTLFLLYGVREKGLSPATVGLIFSVSAVGAVAGALLSNGLMRRYPVGLVYAVLLVCIYASPVLLPLAGGPRPVLIGLFVLSLLITYFGSGASNVIQLSLRQTCTPPALMGRMTAAFRTLLFSGGAFGGLFAGLIGGVMGLRAGLTLVALCSAAMVVPIALSPLIRIRTMPAPITDLPDSVELT
jgi:MFS family permease